MSDSFPNTTKVASSEPCDVAEIFFTNLLLLGFEPAAMEKKYRIPFNKDMFSLPNKKGFEAVARFLFSRLDEARCQEEFRDCWNVRDKKEEQMFRKTCNSWLGQIAKDDPNSYLPRIVSSLFMSPGGDKFNQFMLCFSRYVLQRVMIQENGAKSLKDFLGHPVLTTQNSAMAPAMVNGIMAGSIRQRQKFLESVQDSVFVQEEWNKFAHEQIKEYHSKIKKMRDLERQINEEKSKTAERVAAGTSVLQQKRKSGVTDYDFDIQAVKRAQVIQQVRSMWKVFEDFHATQSFDREIIESILQGTLEKYKIDASELNIKIPDLLLRRCKQELQRRNVDNIYQGGKVNLLSLIHLWNLSLHLYAEKLHEVGVPRLDAAVPSATTMVQTHRAHCANSEALRQKLEFSLLPDLKQSIEHLKKELDRQILSSPASIRITSLGLGLLPPTPPVSFEPHDASPPGSDAITSVLRLNQNHVTTPDAVAQLMREVNDKVQSRHSGLVQGTPVYAPTDRIRTLDTGRSQSNAAPAHELESAVSGIASKVNTKSYAEPSAKHKASRFPASHVKGDVGQKSQAATHVISSQATIPKSTVTRNGRTLDNKQSKPVAMNVRSTATKKSSSRAQPVIAKVDRHHGVMASSTQASRNHLDLLASKIAEAVGRISPEMEIASKKNSFEDAPIDEDAFCSRDKLEHTPPSALRRTWHDTLLHDSIGPLSSTHIESPPVRALLNHNEFNQVAVRLFSPGPPDAADSEITAVMGLNAELPASQDTPRNSTEFQKRTDAGSPLFGADTPSTICSESLVDVEPGDDVVQRPMRDEGQKFGDKGHVQNLEEHIKAEESGEGQQRIVSDAEREREKEEAEVDSAKEEDANEEDTEEEDTEEGEETEKDEELIDVKEMDENGTVWRLAGLQLSTTGITTHKGQGRDVTSTGQGRTEDNNLELVVDDGILAQLNETLQFLRNSKTPRLPTRVSRVTGSSRDAGSLNGSGSSGTSFRINEDAKHPSLTASEPGYRLHDNEHSFGVGSSLPVDLNSVSRPQIIGVAKTHESKGVSGNAVSDTNAKFSKGTQSLRNKVGAGTEQLDGFQTGIPLNRDTQGIIRSDGDTQGVIPSDRDTRPDDSFSMSLRSDMNDSGHSLNSSQKQRQGIPHRVLSQETKTLDASQNSQSADDIDSLILRYRNLRLKQTVDPPAIVSANENPQVASTTSSISQANNDPGNIFTQFSRRSYMAEDRCVSSSQFESTGPKDWTDLTSQAKVEELQKENFDDVRRLLLETSLTAMTPNPRAANRLSTSFCDHLAPSPLTDAVHSTEVSFARLNDSTINLLDLDDSILVPSSPANQIGASVATGNLVDLS